MDHWQEIFEASQLTPRYLFRGFGSTSGDNSALNTVDAVTPRACHNKRAPATLFALTMAESRNLAGGHYRGHGVATPLTSWSQSIALALRFTEYHSDPARPPYLAIIDTKLLPNHKLIIHSELLGRILPGLSGNEWECMAFGVIRGEACCAVRLDTLAQCVPTPGLTALRLQLGRLDLETILNMAETFAERFQIPIAVALATSIPSRHPDLIGSTKQNRVVDEVDRSEELVAHLRDDFTRSPTPVEWTDDPSIDSETVYAPGWEAAQMWRVLRHVAELMYVIVRKVSTEAQVQDRGTPEAAGTTHQRPVVRDDSGDES